MTAADLRDSYASSLPLERRRALSEVLRAGTRLILSTEGRRTYQANGIRAVDVSESQALVRSLAEAPVSGTAHNSGRSPAVYVTVSEAARALETPAPTIRRWGKSGRVESYLAGKTRMVHLEQVTHLAEARSKEER